MSRYISFLIALCFKKLHIPIISFPLLKIQSLTCSFIRINSTDAICAKSIQIPDSLNKIITLSTHLRPSSIQNFISSPLGFFSGTRTCGLNDTPKENVIALDVPRMKKQDVKIEGNSWVNYWSTREDQRLHVGTDFM
ncbi:unnamed protein product [Cuscuta epithymum]|uniref:Uncharacterized protein n=1 Tax=Cuscuta epithymum TaxID=186058 RepID=A0AAV0DCT7_9ASTE|nr:unnamed protein product [Cuscuta epithymum]